MAAEGLATYLSATDDEALAAFRAFSELEGIVPALEASHAIAWLLRERFSGETVLLLLSGRGDKDVEIVRNIVRGS
jgi:tryptophan synthase beta chain